MSNFLKRIVVASVCAAFLAAPAFGADQNRDRKKDQDKVKDGSCLPVMETSVEKNLADNQDQQRQQQRDQKRLKDGTGKSDMSLGAEYILAKNKDRDRSKSKDRLRDGSCLPLVDTTATVLAADQNLDQMILAGRGNGSKGKGGGGSGGGDQKRLKDGSCQS